MGLISENASRSHWRKSSLRWNWVVTLKLGCYVEIGLLHWNWVVTLKFGCYVEIGLLRCSVFLCYVLLLLFWLNKNVKCKCEYDLSTQNPNYLQFSSRRYLLLIVAIQNFQATVSSFGKSSGFLKTLGLLDPTSVGLLILYATQD